ncbi:DNA polymerase III subunit chi [Magnetococcales bacterium HHB-1]
MSEDSLDKKNDVVTPPVVRFYQLSKIPFEQALARLLIKAYEQGLQICVVTSDVAQTNYLDEFLWRFPENGFLPHGQCRGQDTVRQPVLLGERRINPVNGATLLAVASFDVVENFDQFKLILDFVPADNMEALQSSRRRFRFYKERGCTMEYWRQEPDGRWHQIQTK